MEYVKKKLWVQLLFQKNRQSNSKRQPAPAIGRWRKLGSERSARRSPAGVLAYYLYLLYYTRSFYLSFIFFDAPSFVGASLARILLLFSLFRPAARFRGARCESNSFRKRGRTLIRFFIFFLLVYDESCIGDGLRRCRVCAALGKLISNGFVC